ncbi:MAG: hypothetical protein WEB19_04970 [Acidimicrobiia bacterium]
MAVGSPRTDCALSDSTSWRRKADDLRRDPRFALPQPSPPSGVGLFRADLTDASLTRVQGDQLVIDWWRADEPPRQVRRQ